MNLNQIQYVLEVAACGSFTKAAEKLYVTQPAISHQLRALETELGVELFRRDTHSLALTDDGVRFCRYGENVMKAMRELEMAFDVDSGRTNRLRVGLYMFHEIGSLNKIIIDFISQYHIMIKTFSVETADAYRMLESEELDFAVVNNWETEIPSSLEYHVLAREKATLLMSRKHPFAQREYLTLEDMGQVQLMFDEKNPKMYKNFIHICREKGITLLPSAVDPDSPTMEIAAIESNLGVSLMKASTSKYYMNDKLTAVPIKPDLEFVVALLHKKKRKLSALYSAFVKHIMQYAAETEESI